MGGVQVTLDGYAKLDEVLGSLRRVQASRFDIHELVAKSLHEDGAQRFELQTDACGDTWIRATRKHTMPSIAAPIQVARDSLGDCQTRSSRDLVQLSRELVVMLRHKASRRGLMISSSGFVPVEQVLGAFRRPIC